MSVARRPAGATAPPPVFTGETMPEATLLSFLEAARWAPTALPVQPWRFIHGRRETPAWQAIFDSLAAYNRGWAQRASALALVLAATQRLPAGRHVPWPLRAHSFDAGSAWSAVAFQASFAGWHAQGIGGFDRERARKVFAIPDGEAIEAVIALGRCGNQQPLPASTPARAAVFAGPRQPIHPSAR